MSMVVRLIMDFERDVGTLKIFSIYVCSGIFSSVYSSIFLPHQVSDKGEKTPREASQEKREREKGWGCTACVTNSTSELLQGGMSEVSNRKHLLRCFVVMVRLPLAPVVQYSVSIICFMNEVWDL